jgi:hypothetical protein
LRFLDDEILNVKVLSSAVGTERGGDAALCAYAAPKDGQ